MDMYILTSPAMKAFWDTDLLLLLQALDQLFFWASLSLSL